MKNKHGIEYFIVDRPESIKGKVIWTVYYNMNAQRTCKAFQFKKDAIEFAKSIKNNGSNKDWPISIDWLSVN